MSESFRTIANEQARRRYDPVKAKSKKRDPEKKRARERDYWARNRERLNAQHKAARSRRLQETPERVVEQARAAEKRRHFKRSFEFTLADRDAVYEESDGLCALCYEEPAEVLDHDHKTHYVRGALCRRHNLGLGFFDDDPAMLLRAAEYLTEVVARD